MGENNSKFFFVLLSVCTTIGIGNLWLYPYFSFKLTGLFFIPYLTALVLFGMPMIMLEISIGQYFSKNVVDLFGSIKKWIGGVGWLMVINAFILMSVYAAVLSWHIIYIFVSFGLQWKNDANSYLFSNVLQASQFNGSFAQFSLPVFIALIAAWVLIFFYIRKGIEGIKKWFLATSIIFVLLMFWFMLYSLTLDNALAGVYFFLKPRFKSLLNFRVWLDAFALAAMSLGISFGAMTAFARKSKGFVAGSSFAVALFKLLTSISIGFIVFSMLGFLSLKNGIVLKDSSLPDSSFPFATLAQALPFFYKPVVSSLLFFIFLAIFFIFGTAALAYSVSNVLAHKLDTKQRNAAVVVCGCGFLFGLLFVIKPGFYIMDIAIHFFYYNVLIVVLLEALAVGWFFNADKLSEYISYHSFLKIGKLWKVLVKYFVPLIVLVLLFFQAKSDLLLNYKNYPLWALLAFGIGFVVIPIIAAFLLPQRMLDRR